jgi:4-hydroxy-2-oxoheptanedioate aldolase
MIGPHRLKQKLKAGEFVTGPILNFNAPWLVDLSGPIGFDFVMIDAEHGPLSPESAELMIRAAEGGGLTPVVRVPANVPHEILRFLDIGASAIQIPHIDSADDARRAVAAIKYPPMGERGHAPTTRAAGYGIDQSPGDYVDLANRETMVLAMIESVAAVDNVDAILDVEGIDALIMGPGDLSLSMGHRGVRDAPEVERAVDHVISRAARRGIPVSMPAASADGIRACHSRGVHMVFFAFTSWLVQSCRQTLKEAAK